MATSVPEVLTAVYCWNSFAKSWIEESSKRTLPMIRKEGDFFRVRFDFYLHSCVSGWIKFLNFVCFEHLTAFTSVYQWECIFRHFNWFYFYLNFLFYLLFLGAFFFSIFILFLFSFSPYLELFLCVAFLLALSSASFRCFFFSFFNLSSCVRTHARLHMLKCLGKSAHSFFIFFISHIFILNYFILIRELLYFFKCGYPSSIK